MLSFNDICELRNDGSYQRDNFDSFLSKIKFSFQTPAIHIAGTNGKGTTANFIANIYTNAGYKVGLFTSPCFAEINEDIRINGQPISDEVIKEYVADYKKEIKKFDLSPFELETFIALSYFQKEKCDICVIECGMGGETDATNVFTPVLSILTSVGMEHTSFLGKTIFEIAYNKLGITREKTPLLVGKIDDQIIDVVKDVSKEKELQVFMTSEASNVVIDNNGISFNYSKVMNVHLLTHSRYSVDDACLAIDTIDILKEKFPVSNENILKGLLTMELPLRFHIISSNPLVIIDGAHNPQAMYSLKISLQNFSISTDIHTLFSCFRDKNLPGLLNEAGEFSKSLTLTTFAHPRARTAEDYFLYLEEYKFVENPVEALNNLLSLYPTEAFVITGSLAFAGFMYKSFLEGKFDVLKK